MSDACHPIFRYGGPTSRPVVAAGTTTELISSRPVHAATVMRLVIGVPEFVMKALAPSITHSSPSRVARVRIAPASLPASGSVSPNAARARPAHSSGSHRARCSSVPNRAIGAAPSPTPASRVIAIEESTRAISSIARHSVVKSASEPPYSCGKGRPKRPSSPIARTTSVGNVPSRSQASAHGAISCSAKSRTTLAKPSCSGVKSRSMVRWSASPAWMRSGSTVR